MATYKKYEFKLLPVYNVEIDYYLDETVFNGEYLKNEDGQLVYFGLQNVDGDYLNKLSDADLTNCITSNDDNYTISVENSGVHIPEQELENIYAKFYRLDKSGDRTKKSYGLGLAIVKRILDLHESVYSISNSDNGVLFKFTLSKSDEI